jgi:hypothetical protein
MCAIVDGKPKEESMTADLVLSDGTEYFNRKPNDGQEYERVKVLKTTGSLVLMWRAKAAKK